MRDLRNLITDVDVLISLSPEELAAKIIFLLRKTSPQENRGMFQIGNLANQFDRVEDGHENNYPSNRKEDAKLALFEAWAWLESQALLVWPDSANGGVGWRRLSRRALAFQDENEFLAFATSKQLRPEMLHDKIAMPVWKAFSRGEFDVAIFQSMKAVEVAVREKGGYGAKDIGVALMRKAFHTENGVLTDQSDEYPEREALGALFAGAIGLFKNPQSHKNVGVSDARETIEIILLANHLLRIVDSRGR